MKPINFVKQLSIAFAAVGLLVPSSAVTLAAPTQPGAAQNAPASVKVIDVALQQNGTLQGQVVNGHGVVQAQAPVTIYQGKDVVATAKTNANGEFAVSGLKGGTYVVSTGAAAGVVRAWAPRTAPPAAVSGVMLVHGDQVLAQNGIVNRFGTGALIVGAVVGTIIAVAIDHNTGS